MTIIYYKLNDNLEGVCMPVIIGLTANDLNSNTTGKNFGIGRPISLQWLENTLSIISVCFKAYCRRLGNQINRYFHC